MKGKRAVPVLLLLLMLLGMIPTQADAAGMQHFDFENAGVKQVYTYQAGDKEWQLDSRKQYDYYSNGTIKTVTMESEYWNYEGHYDPHGHLMDPMYTFYAGYVEGILLDVNAKPVRKYDAKGRLTHFEAQALNFDVPEATNHVEADYEYDSKNRVSRVHIEYRYLTLENEEMETGAPVTNTGFIFSYGASGEYTIFYEATDAYDNHTRTSFSFNADHRLRSFESGYEYFSDDEVFSESNIYRWTYDDEGFLILWQQFRNGSDFSGAARQLKCTSTSTAGRMNRLCCATSIN